MIPLAARSPQTSPSNTPGSPAPHWVVSLLWQQQVLLQTPAFPTLLHSFSMRMCLTGCRVHTPVIKNTQCSYSTINRLPTQLLSQVWPSHPLIPALTARHGGLGIPYPLQPASPVHCLLIGDSSVVELIRQQTTNYPVGLCLKQRQVKATIHISTAVMQPKR